MAKVSKKVVKSEVEANVEAVASNIKVLLDSIYPNHADGLLAYARARFVENLVWRADKDYEFQEGKAAEAQVKYDEAMFIQRAITEQQNREGESQTMVYDTQVERAERWNERMQLQLQGASEFRDAAHLALESLSQD
jgi:hypothetical protein